MARWGSVDFREFKRVCKKMEELTKIDLDKFCKDAARELAARLLGKVIRRTPVDTGFLRQGWNGGAYARSLPVYKQGNNYIIEVVNPTEYALTQWGI
ncbi:HK97 gp10 family phage protein [Clostridioides difficile]|uniref:HK97 gp10 family phage protein n=1 Tax=Clostridioides difficile TaxID=1496 RepID=UPI00038C8DD0|nr:HK97 gp10 family phage protein [Clostridioides difficile]EQI29270.1 putative phage domain protein [Clostridioides difficile Y165]